MQNKKKEPVYKCGQPLRFYNNQYLNINNSLLYLHISSSPFSVRVNKEWMIVCRRKTEAVRCNWTFCLYYHNNHVNTHGNFYSDLMYVKSVIGCKIFAVHSWMNYNEKRNLKLLVGMLERMLNADRFGYLDVFVEISARNQKCKIPTPFFPFRVINH